MLLELKGLKQNVEEKEEALSKMILKKLKADAGDIKSYRILRKSIDARKKGRIYFIYNIAVEVADDKALTKKVNGKDICLYREFKYTFSDYGKEIIENRPIIIGCGPAGLFSALVLAENGYNPLILERGRDIDRRTLDIEFFMEGKGFTEKSNIQFGEGGAGTYSDGKLTTRIKDPRISYVLEKFVEFGAPKEILYENKPHIGTDVLKKVIKNMRKHIEKLGGQILFDSQVTNIIEKSGIACGVVIEEKGDIASNAIICAIGHSARDTYEMLYKKGFAMEAKPIAIGVRVEHFQEMINQAQYGIYAGHFRLGAADYMLTHRSESTGRSVYTFCMCPGGIVVAAASEKNKLVVNGMSYHKRDGINANSAVVVTVHPKDYGHCHPLSGIGFQRYWEEKAYNLGGGGYSAPVQLISDFLKDRPTKKLGKIKPTYKPDVTFAELKKCLPDYVTIALKEALTAFDKRLKGFACGEGILTAIETRTSAPLRIIRKENMESVNLANFYPAGEGAGYAGGIMSSAVDGVKAAEAIMKRFKPLD